MACDPFSPQVGVFGAAVAWGTVNSAPWSFKVAPDAASGITTYSLLKSGAPVTAVQLPSTYVGRWAWFPGGTLAALRGLEDNAQVWTARIFLFDLKTAPTPAPGEVAPPFSANAASANFHAHASPDSSLLLLYMIDNMNTSGPHRIIRTDNRTNVLEWAGQIQSSDFRAAEVTPAHVLRFFTSPVPQPGAGTGQTIATVELPPPVAITGGVFNAAGADLPKEVITIENCGAAAIALGGWTLSDRQNHIYTFPAFSLAGKAKVNVWTKSGPDSGVDLFMNRDKPVWTNTGDMAILRDGQGREVSRLDYPGGTGSGSGGVVGQWPSAPPVKIPPLVSTASFEIPESTSGVDTGIDLQAGDWLDIHASGSIWAGVALTGQNGPQGWDSVSDDPKFPLHDGPYAHPFSLIGFVRANGQDSPPFYIGDVFLGRAPSEGRLFLRTNDDVPGNGADAFTATVGLRRDSGTALPAPRPPVVVDVPESSNEVDTGVDVADGEYLEIEADGNIWAGVWATGENGPDGWPVDHDAKFPLHTGPLARPFSLIGFFKNGHESPPFYVGGSFGPQKQAAPFTGRLFLRTNDDTPNNGSGQFVATIRVRPKV